MINLFIRAKTLVGDLLARLHLRLSGGRSELLNQLLQNDIAQLHVQLDQVQSLQNLQAEQRQLQAGQQALEDSLEKMTSQLTEAASATLAAIEMGERRLATKLEERFRVDVGIRQRIFPQSYSPKSSNLGPETDLLCYLYPYLPDRTAVDAGANLGEFSGQLLEAGYQVIALEPFPPVFAALQEKFRNQSDFSALNLALGDCDGMQPLHLAGTTDNEQPSGDSHLYHSLIRHPLAGDYHFTDQIEVPVSRLDSLQEKGDIPRALSILKIDTEGMDALILRSLRDASIPVVMAEFWGPDHAFTKNSPYVGLKEMCDDMKAKGYYWQLIFAYAGTETPADAVFRISLSTTPSGPEKGAWGNVIFFSDYRIFQAAWDWCLAHTNWQSAGA
jgi:FkbM family methyltransferase